MKYPSCFRCLGTLLFLLACVTFCAAEVRCPRILGSHMVLQRGLPVPIWGTAEPGEKVEVIFAGQTLAALADQEGRWLVRLEPMQASTQGRPLRVRGTNELVFEEVLVGEVWFCSGQSNMEKPLGVRSGQKPTDNAAEAIRNATDPLLRVYQVSRPGTKTDNKALDSWQRCEPSIIDGVSFSAAAYYFGRELTLRLGVPVGLVHSSYGGTRIEPWTEPGSYSRVPGLEVLDEAGTTGRQIDGSPIGNLYASMVKPYVPFGLRGFLWYQGESNMIFGENSVYADKQRALIRGWRSAWGREDAPFYFVQIAPYLYSDRQQPRLLSPEALPLFWEAQAQVLSLPNTGIAATTDLVADLRDIHPTNKRDVGLRLAALALARTYHLQGVVDSGPRYVAMRQRGSAIEVEFSHAGGLASRDGKPLQGFALAGEDRSFHPATARIVEGRVVVESPQVGKPVAVRMGWHEAANPNLVNGAGLPAYPFRTDSWPVVVGAPKFARKEGPPMRLPDVVQPVIPERSVLLTDFGAVGDGIASNTEAFKAALESLAKQGGGRLVVPKGVWLTGPVVLRSKIELQVQRGALIRFSPRREDYPLNDALQDGSGEWRCQPPLSGTDLEDVAITGEGVIDGAGEVWRPVKKFKQTDAQWKALLAGGGVLNKEGDVWYPSVGSREGNENNETRRSKEAAERERVRDALRPNMVVFRNCKRVLLQGVTFQNSPAWCLHPLGCEDLTVRGVTVLNPWYSQNGDGLDVDSCKNVLIERCTFDVGDDAICLKSGKDEAGRRRRKPTENVLVANCTVRHGHGGLVVGSEMSSGVRNVWVRDCDFKGTDVGLRFKSTRGRGGVVQNVHVERVRMENILREAILFDLFYSGRGPTDPGQDPSAVASSVPPVGEGTPAFRNIQLREISCKGAQRAFKLQGLPEMPLENISLVDLDIEATEGGLVSLVDGLQFRGVKLQVAKGPVLAIEDSRGIEIMDTVLQGPGLQASVSGRRTQGVVLVRTGGKDRVSLAAGMNADVVRFVSE